MEELVRSDLAMECEGATEGQGVRVQRSRVGALEILRVHICTDEAARRLGKPVGRYITVQSDEHCRLNEGQFDRLRCALAVELRELSERMCERRIGRGFSVLVAGLGNREITPDAIGPETVRRLSVTRHLHQAENALFSTVGLCEISAITPGVTAQTGLETVEIIRAAVNAVRPDLVIAVDALAARSVERLCSTVQLCDSGIQPGSGLGSRHKALSKETVGVPVMGLGMPTVVDSSVLVYGALQKAGMPEPTEELRRALETGKGFFVSPKEIDLQVSVAATLLASALEKAFDVGERLLD